MIASRCKNCLWFDHVHKSLAGADPSYGLCRKHKPLVYESGKRYWAAWPMVDENDLCGEFRLDESAGISDVPKA